MYDVSGQRTIRPYWKHYFEGTDALVRLMISFLTLVSEYNHCLLLIRGVDFCH